MRRRFPPVATMALTVLAVSLAYAFSPIHVQAQSSSSDSVRDFQGSESRSGSIFNAKPPRLRPAPLFRESNSTFRRAQAVATNPPMIYDGGQNYGGMSVVEQPPVDSANSGMAEPGGDGKPAEEEKEDDTTPLMKFLGAEESPIKVYGWIQNSITGNAHRNGKNAFNFGVSPNSLAGRWMGNQYTIVVEDPLEQNDEINFGFRVDSQFGHDWAFTHMHGFLDGEFQLGSFRGFDLPQAYAQIHLPGLTEGGVDIKAGRFYTLAGYETVPAITRPLLSVPYMFNFGQPFTHFGAMATFHMGNGLDIHHCIHNGWDRWVNENYDWGYMGGFNWTFNEEKTSLAFTGIWGPNQFPRFLPANLQIPPTGSTPPPFMAGLPNPQYSSNDRLLFTTVLSHKWTDKLTQVIETDQAWEENIPNLGPNGLSRDAAWFSLGNWFLYNWSDKLTTVWRSEVFWDQDGARVFFKNPDRYYEVTLGAIYKPCKWLWIRPEARYDWSQFGSPYDNGTKDSQFTYGVDAIILF